MTQPAVHTTCPYCGVGCGVLVSFAEDGKTEIRGDPTHPANAGRLCSKGAALEETLGPDARLLYPEIRGQRASWDAALDAVADGFARTLREHGPDSVAFYVSGQLLTEDYYVANKLMKGFMGSANIDTNSRLCMASSVAGHKRAFGGDIVPGNYEDLELANLVVLVGSNTAWCHPVVFQRLVRAKQTNPDLRVVVIDPRRTDTCDTADLHLALKPGSDVLLFNGLLTFLHANGDANPFFVHAHTEGAESALAAARQSAPDIAQVAHGCGLSEEAVTMFYRWFSRHEKTVTVYSQGVNQSSSGTDKVNAIINCHLLTGRIGRPGMGPFSLTGQPNAMGGREVGGLANQLAAHMDFDRPEHIDRVSRFWNASAIARRPGLKAVEMFDAIGAGHIKAVWIMATNPVVSLPDADKVRAALERCELVVVSDCVRHTDTTALAHILLPAQAWGEKDGSVTNSERRISRQRAFAESAGDAKPDWWMVCEVARRLGFGTAFDYATAADVFREHAALSGFENSGARGFDISALAMLDDAGYERLTPIQWPVTDQSPAGTARLFADGRFFSLNRKARFVALTPRPPAHALSADYPLALNTGRVRDQWHTMTRTGLSPRLASHTPEPFVEVHPRDASAQNLIQGGLARLESRWGTMLARIHVSEHQQPGNVYVPMHWNDQYARLARADALVNPATDPVSGQPELKHTPIRIGPYTAAWYGFVLSRRALTVPADAEYCVRVRGKDFWRYELAGRTASTDWPGFARALLCTSLASGERAEWVELLDAAQGRYHGVRLLGRAQGAHLESVAFIAPTISLPPRAWLASLFAKEILTRAERAHLVAGSLPQNQTDTGEMLCACFGITRSAVQDAIRRENLDDAAAVGRLLKAGTNCGSCLPEIRALITAARTAQQPA